MKSLKLLLLCPCLLVAVAGCADPTKDKPKAVVDEPAPAPERPAAAVEFVTTEASAVGFVGSKITGSHEGGFRSFEGRISLVGGDPLRSSVDVSIDTTSLWADDDRLTGHLKSSDFFDVEHYPTASFTSTEIVREGDGYRVVRNLTLHSVSKSIAFPATIGVEDGQVTATAEFAVKRFDFDIVYPGKPDDLIRDDVLIRLNLVAVPAAAAS
jgi:polyisoprenoid-binding protein YceI